MKTVKSLFKVTVALILAFALMTLTACDVINGLFNKGGDDNAANGDGKEYTVTFIADGGTLSEELTKYTSGTAKQLPDAEKAHYTFGGWYADDSLSGNPVTSISEKEKGNKTYYAKWTPETYSVEFTIKNDTAYQADLNSYTYNRAVSLPAPTKSGSTFNGWYEKEDLSGNIVTSISAGQYGAKHYYGEWLSGNVEIYNVNLVLNGGTLKGSNITSYVKGKGATLPDIEKTNYTFEGWYTNSNFTGSPVTEISATDTGDKTFYAKFEKVTSTSLNITAYGGYEEGAYVEFPTVGGVSAYTVSYKGASDSNYTTIDKELVRVNSTDKTVRADVVGLKAGDYTLKVDAGSQSKTVNVSVTAYDRSGYAHFNYTSGVGGYKDDGTQKSNANIVYVTEATKNTVQAKIDGSTYTGIVSILKNAGTKTPLIVRIIGTVGAATWEKGKIDYNKNNEYSAKNPMSDDLVKGINNKGLGRKSWEQKDLISGGYNVLDESVYEELDGLSSKIKWDSKKTEYDSCWNDCNIQGVKNVTVEGIGTDARIFQWGMTFKNCNSIEVRNLTFEDYTEDACSFEGSTTSMTAKLSDFTHKNFWVHHNTFEEGVNYWDVCSEQDKHDGDGSTDFKGLSNVTLSYNVYNKTHKTGLIGGSNSQSTASITFHHNYYNGCKSRLPLARRANMHMYNNYYHNAGTSISLRAQAYALVEYCYFDGSENTMIDIQGDGTNETEDMQKYGVAKLVGCVMKGKGYSYSNMPSSIMPSKDKLTALNTKFILKTDDRTATITNYNQFGTDFDMNASIFYYDVTKKESKVTAMIKNANLIPTEIPNVAGVHKNK